MSDENTQISPPHSLNLSHTQKHNMVFDSRQNSVNSAHTHTHTHTHLHTHTHTHTFIYTYMCVCVCASFIILCAKCCVSSFTRITLLAFLQALVKLLFALSTCKSYTYFTIYFTSPLYFFSMRPALFALSTRTFYRNSKLCIFVHKRKLWNCCGIHSL